MHVDPAAAAPVVRWISDNVAGPVGQVFLRMLLMTVIPLVFTSITLGVAGIGMDGVSALGQLEGAVHVLPIELEADRLDDRVDVARVHDRVCYHSTSCAEHRVRSAGSAASRNHSGRSTR